MMLCPEQRSSWSRPCGTLNDCRLAQLCHDPAQSSEIGILKLILLVLSSDNERSDQPEMKLRIDAIENKLDTLIQMLQRHPVGYAELLPSGGEHCQSGASLPLATPHEPRTPSEVKQSDGGSRHERNAVSLQSPRTGLYSRIQANDNNPQSEPPSSMNGAKNGQSIESPVRWSKVDRVQALDAAVVA
jgi:hypothetical protein